MLGCLHRSVDSQETSISSGFACSPEACLLVSAALVGDVTRFASEIHHLLSVGISEHSPACRENLMLQATRLVLTTYVNVDKQAALVSTT
jgi:hypothetical protein